MRLSTPVQHQEIENDNKLSIRDGHSDYEATFVILHPFLRINEGANLVFSPGKWPTKRQIINEAVAVSWTTVIEGAGLKDIKEVDRLLGFLHCASKTADREGWNKFMTYVDANNLIVPQVDDFPEILIDKTLNYLMLLGYQDVFHYSDIDIDKKLYNIDSLIEDDHRLPSYTTRIMTPDHRILFETEYDSRVTYLSSTIKIIESMVSALDFEGFYCGGNTKAYWSYDEQKENLIDWDSPERYNHS